MPFILEESGGEGGPDTVQELVNAVLEDGQLDATPVQALRWLDVRHRQMCARTKCYRQTLTLGSTIGGQSSYPIPFSVIEILEVRVGGLVYGSARHNDFAEGERGYVWLGGGEGGIAGRDDDASGNKLLRLFPAPKSGIPPEPGAEISLYAVVQPPPLAIGDDDAIKIPPDYFDALVSGAIATAQLRVENRPDLASPHEQIFTAACVELTRATARKFRGTGPALIRVKGINA